MSFFLYFMKKNDLFPDTGSKLIAVFQNVGFQLVDVLASQMVYHHKMQAVTFGIMTSTIEVCHLAINNIPIGVRP